MAGIGRSYARMTIVFASEAESGGWTSHAGDGSRGRRSRNVEVDIGKIRDEREGEREEEGSGR